MYLLSLHSTPRYLRSTISCSSRTPKFYIPKTNFTIPARDRVIDFGKFKGKMLGTLPSTYLKWVSKNLRARDFEAWAKLADEVLDDPLYRDRIEWEFAQKVLDGDVLSYSLSSRAQRGAVSELLEISERFGWDNDDKEGWAKIDFGLLGTSKGGRIPRLSTFGPRPNIHTDRTMQPTLTKVRHKKEVGNCEGTKRKERRERSKLRRDNITKMENVDKLVINNDCKGIFGNSNDNRTQPGSDEGLDENRMVEIKSPFPGREALLKKALNSRRYRSN